nr:MAG TPA: hypothetical protein [Bacteriophage sp.]
MQTSAEAKFILIMPSVADIQSPLKPCLISV